LDTGTNALEQGADAYLIKPVRPEELMALLSWKLKTNQLKSANQTVFGWQSRKKL
jgi:DNA-binding response OmpR family regulator